MTPQLTQDLFFNTEVVCCPIVREKDGLAMSSRNLRLSPAERSVANKLYEALMLARHSLLEGQSVQSTKDTIQNFFATLFFTLKSVILCIQTVSNFLVFLAVDVK